MEQVYKEDGLETDEFNGRANDGPDDRANGGLNVNDWLNDGLDEALTTADVRTGRDDRAEMGTIDKTNDWTIDETNAGPIDETNDDALDRTNGRTNDGALEEAIAGPIDRENAGTNIVAELVSDLSAVIVRDAAQMRALWQRGSFGKGSLSRSQPTFERRQLRAERLATGEAELLPEEVTAERRAKRRALKQQRALEALRLNIDTLYRENNFDLAASKQNELDQLLQADDTDHPKDQSENQANDQSKGQSYDQLKDQSNDQSKNQAKDKSTLQMLDLDPQSQSQSSTQRYQNSHVNEHLQLTLEEAYYLASYLSVLTVTECGRTLQHEELLPRFASAAHTDTRGFLCSYAIYSHFRRLGWIVRLGAKFGVDWLLYRHGGPSQMHAEFAVVVTPTANSAVCAASWQHLYALNRIQNQVRKSLVICCVEDVQSCINSDGHAGIDSIASNAKAAQNDDPLACMAVREIGIKRWNPARDRGVAIMPSKAGKRLQ